MTPVQVAGWYRNSRPDKPKYAHSAEEVSKLLKDAIKSFTEQVFYYNRDVHYGCG